MSFTYAGLCSGIGMLEHACEVLGGEPVLMCEPEPFCQVILRLRYPGIPLADDVHGLDGSSIDAGVLVFGFPCTDISVAGRAAGITGPKSGLWRECFRVLSEMRPRVVLIENVAALVNRGLSRVLSDLRSIGYDAEWDVISAASVGAAHLRERVWIVARPTEYAEQPVYPGASLGMIDLDGKLPRAGRMTDGRLVAISPIAPRKTERRDGWSYWGGKILFDLDAVGSLLLPTPSAVSYGNNRGGAAGRVGATRHSLDSMANHNLWPTPGRTPAQHMAMRESIGRTGPSSLAVAVQMWPTPTSTMADHGGRGDLLQAVRGNESPSGHFRARVAQGIPGPLNPTWVEWLMAIPLWWTDPECPTPLVTQAPWWYEPESIPRTELRAPHRKDRLKAVGNSICWPCAYYVLDLALRATPAVPDA